MVTVHEIPLKSLRIIRGLSLYKPSFAADDPAYSLAQQGFSLYVAGNRLGARSDIGLRTLQLTALQGKHLYAAVYTNLRLRTQY